MERIEQFQGEWRWLSNFWPAVVEYEGEKYPTVEHAYQAAKLTGPIQRLRFQVGAKPQLTPAQAKRTVRGLPLRDDWDDVKLSVMADLVRQKFSAEPLRSRLIATGDAEIIEGNWWGDTFWGVCRGKGQNHLGRIIMQVRLSPNRS